jgi:hypothetical protein
MVPKHPPTGNAAAPERAAKPSLLAPALLCLALHVATAAGGRAQERTGGQGAFRDPAAATLIERARAARHRDIEGIRSYEGVLRERIHVGLTALRFRRERGLFDQERIARLRWSADGERAIQWLGARRAVPIVGADTRRDEIAARDRVAEAGADVRDDLRRGLPQDLLRDASLPAFAFDPAGDRLAFGGDWALHPLADTAEAHYRFASGDTLRIHLPPDRDVVLFEVRVEPRRSDFHLVAGSLWFDAESASLVRASYRPARAFNLLLDEPEDAEDVPGILQPVEAEISYITVEYSLHEFRYWLPRRFALEGEARLGRVASIPMTVEWSVGDYDVNGTGSTIPATGPLPPGWSRREQRVEDEDGRVSYVTVVVPEPTALLSYPELSDDFGQRTPTAFSDQEIDELRGELEALVPTYRRFQPRFSWGFSGGQIRFNRVEGLSVGATTTTALTPSTSFEVQARLGTGDREPNASVALHRGGLDRRWSLSGYHRLQAMGDWGEAFGVVASAQQLVLGSNQGQYYRASGASLGHSRSGSRVRLRLDAFYQEERPVEAGSDFSLVGLFGDDTVATVLAADALTLRGVRGDLRWFAGSDPNHLILTGQVLGEIGDGDASYRRAAVTMSASHPLPFGLAGALEAGAGGLWGDEVLQRSWFLGESRTLRGFRENTIRGASFWRGRAELASGFAGARLGLFADAGWAGPRDAFTLDDPLVALGVGTSLLDGLFRLDVARAVRRGSAWRVHLYLDGLF